MHAALMKYETVALRPLLDLLAAEAPFQTILRGLIDLASQDRAAAGLPEGCLFVDLYNNRARLGPLTHAQVADLGEQTVNAYARCIAHARASGELQIDIPTHTAAVYLDAQLGNAMTLRRRGDSIDTVQSVLELALSVFKPPGRHTDQLDGHG